MNLRKMLIAFGLSLAVGGGLATGFANNNKALETKASTATKVYCAIDEASVTNDLNISNFILKCKVNYKGDGDWNEEHTMSYIGDGTTYPGKRVYVASFTDQYDGLGALQFQVFDGSTYKINCAVFGWYDWTSVSVYNNKLRELTWNGTSLSSTSWVDYTPTTSKWTIAKKAVEFEDGVGTVREGEGWNLPADEAYDGTVPSLSETAISLEHFVGWYTDAACLTEYTPTEIYNDIIVYAKYQKLSLDSYFYWVDKDSSDLTNGYVYFWGEYQTGWSEVSLSSCKVSNVLKLEGQACIYKIPVPSTGNVSCLMHNASGNVQTFNIESIARGAVYYTWYDNTGGDGKYYYAFSSVANKGLAADFLIEFEDYRNNVGASGTIKQYSICGISPENAAYLYGKYEVLDAGVKEIVDHSVTYTYAGKDTTDETEISFVAMMEEIYTIALRDSEFAKTHSAMRYTIVPNENNDSALIISIAALATIGAAGAFVLFRKRREN